MTDKEITRLKGILEREGFDVSFQSIDRQTFTIESKKEELIEFTGWEYGNIPCEIRFHFVFNQSIFKTIQFDETGKEIESFLKQYLTS